MSRTRHNIKAMQIEPLSKKPYRVKGANILPNTIFRRETREDKTEIDAISFAREVTNPAKEQRGLDKNRTHDARFEDVLFSPLLSMRNYDFRYSTFTGKTNLSACHLEHADFSGANLWGLNLEQASLCNAKFIGTHFHAVALGKFDADDSPNAYGTSRHTHTIFFDYGHSDLPQHIEAVLNNLVGEDENDTFHLERTGTILPIKQARRRLAKEEDPETQAKIRRNIEQYSVINNLTSENLETLRAMILHSLVHAIAKNDITIANPIAQLMGTQGLAHKFFADTSHGAFNIAQYGASLIRGLISTNSLSSNRTQSFASHRNTLILCTYLLSRMPKLTHNESDIRGFFLKLKNQMLEIIAIPGMTQYMTSTGALLEIMNTRQIMPGQRPTGQTKSSKRLLEILPPVASARPSNFCGSLFSCCNPKNQTVGPDAPPSAAALNENADSVPMRSRKT